MPLARAIALNIIRSFVPMNLPESQIIHYLQQMKISYRRTDMLSDIRTAFDRVKYESQITKLGADKIIPEAWMNTEKLGAPYNYRVHLKVVYYDPDTQLYSTEHRFMFSDDLLSVGDYAEQFPDYAMSKDYVEDKSFEGAQVVGLTKNMREGVPF